MCAQLAQGERGCGSCALPVKGHLSCNRKWLTTCVCVFVPTVLCWWVSLAFVGSWPSADRLKEKKKHVVSSCYTAVMSYGLWEPAGGGERGVQMCEHPGAMRHPQTWVTWPTPRAGHWFGSQCPTVRGAHSWLTVCRWGSVCTVDVS